MHNYKLSLLKKFSIAIIVILCPIIITFILSYYNNKEDLTAHIKNDLSVIAEAYELQIYQFVEMSRRRVHDFASDGTISEHFQKIVDGGETADRFLNDYLTRNKKSLDSSIHSISLLTFDGRIHASTDSSRIGKSFIYEPDLLEKNSRTSVGEMETAFSGFEQIVVMAPIFSKSKDKPIGIIVNHIFLTELNRLLSGKLVTDLITANWRKDENTHINRHRTMEVYLVNKDKLMITESKFVENSILRQAVDTPPVRECINNYSEMSGFYKDYRGVDVAGASICIPSMQWTLIVEIDTDEVMEPLSDMRRNALIAGSIVIGLIILFFIFLIRKIITPIKRISLAADSIASGNYDVTIPVQTSDEIGVLAGLFNKMGQEIKNRANNLTERQRLIEERLELQRKYEELVNNLNVGIYRISENGDLIEANKAAIILSQAERKEELLQHNVRDFFLNKNDFNEFMSRILRDWSIENVDLELKTLKGNTFYASISAVLKRDIDGKIFIDGVIEDITRIKRLEIQLRIAQKMEAVGQLAGGIAHDFNNILTGITGYSTLLSMKTETDQVLKGYASNIIALSDKAANLTQGLLAFSRKQVMNIEVHDLNEIIKRFISMVTRIIGDNIEILSILSDDKLPVMADATQIEQVLMNLVTNAKDAMVNGGTITIESFMIPADDISLSKKDVRTRGYFALLKFTDSGTGIPPELMDKIFDPFFTTKEVGKGTGLGLSIVHGIVEQHNGIIKVESKSGNGATFNIFLPITDALAIKRKETETLFNLPHGKETILLAEDDMQARITAKTILEEFGYNVVEAIDGEDAVKKFTGSKGKFDLVIMDMIMPGMDGRSTFDEIRKIKPDVKVIFTSGYLSEMMKVMDIIEEELNFISKPVAPDELLTKIREVIET